MVHGDPAKGDCCFASVIPRRPALLAARQHIIGEFIEWIDCMSERLTIAFPLLGRRPGPETFQGNGVASQAPSCP